MNVVACRWGWCWRWSQFIKRGDCCCFRWWRRSIAVYVLIDYFAATFWHFFCMLFFMYLTLLWRIISTDRQIHFDYSAMEFVSICHWTSFSNRFLWVFRKQQKIDILTVHMDIWHRWRQPSIENGMGCRWNCHICPSVYPWTIRWPLVQNSILHRFAFSLAYLLRDVFFSSRFLNCTKSL